MAHLFGAKLRYLRQQYGLTQAEIAQSLSSRSYLAEIESGKETPSLRVILRAARLFGVSTDYLLRDTVPIEDIQTSAEEFPDDARNDDALPQRLGAKLRALRIQRTLTQATLARQLGLAQHAYISNLEAGRKTPSPDLVVQIADFFGVTTDYLLHDAISVK